MSIATDISKAVLRSDEAVFGDLLRLATGDRSGFQFRGVLMPTELVNPETLMRDPREAAMLEVNRDDYPQIYAWVKPSDRIKQGAANWTVVGREDNPADVVVKFTLVKVVAGKDT